MFKITHNVSSQKNIISTNKKNNIFNIIDSGYSYTTIFNQLNKNLLIKEIEPDGISKKEKKENDINIKCANFTTNNLLNVFNKTDIRLNCNNFTKNDNVNLKKQNSYSNMLSDNLNFLQNIKNYKIKKVKEKIHTLQKKPLFNQLIHNKNRSYLENKLCDIIPKHTNLIKLKYSLNKTKKDILNIKSNNIKTIQNENNSNFLKNIKNCNKIFLNFKNTSKNNSLIYEKNSLKNVNNKKYIQPENIETCFFNDSSNSIKWKKLISKKILLSIFNKKNQVEMNLKPENLGSIYIRINMKKNLAILNFVSNRKEIRNFLDNSIPYLRDSLNKNGIKLEKFNIYSSLKKIKLQNHKNFFIENFFKKICNIDKGKQIQYKSINIYV